MAGLGAANLLAALAAGLQVAGSPSASSAFGLLAAPAGGLPVAGSPSASSAFGLSAAPAGALPVAGSPSASSAASGANGRTRLLPVLCGALLLVVGLALAPLFVLVPEPALAVVVIMAVRPFLSLAPPRAYLRRDRRALIVWSAAALGVMLFTLVPGLLIAVGLSLLIFIGEASRLRVSRLGRTTGGAYLDLERAPDLTPPAGAAVPRPDGQIFSANVDRIATAVTASSPPANGPSSSIWPPLSSSARARSRVWSGSGTASRSAAEPWCWFTCASMPATRSRQAIWSTCRLTQRWTRP